MPSSIERPSLTFKQMLMSKHIPIIEENEQKIIFQFEEYQITFTFGYPSSIGTFKPIKQISIKTLEGR